MRSFILVIHIVSSLAVCFATLVVVFRSVYALKMKYDYKSIDKSLPRLIVLLLYIQLFLGIILFIFLINDYKAYSLRISQNGNYCMRFWGVEHFSLMLFTVIFGHIGYIYNKNTIVSKAIFQKNRFYFGITFLLLCLSMIISMIKYFN
ncbi:MAG: hypothetical protein JW717_14245 [Marinilabiliaceae bacterium]|nr:hypothetical protein [Marinilabiliaceae bacterium]